MRSASFPRILSDASTWCQTRAYANAVWGTSRKPGDERRETGVLGTYVSYLLGHYRHEAARMWLENEVGTNKDKLRLAARLSIVPLLRPAHRSSSSPP